VGAQVTMTLDRSAGPIPVDSVIAIRPRSALGEENVEITKGTSTRMLRDGGTLPVSQSREEVELDQVLSTFDKPTRDAARTGFLEFGNALAGRGADLNTTLQRLPDTFRYLEPVAANLASPQTDLRDFFRQVDITADTIAPVSPTFAHLFTTMANTLAAIDRDPSALRQTISKTPPTLDVGTQSFHAQLPFLRDTARLGRLLTPASTALRSALPALNQAISVGTRVIRRTPALYQDLQQALVALRNLAQAPVTDAALRGLTATVATVQPQVRYLGPYVTVCNYWTTFWTFAAEPQTAPGVGGSVLRSELNSTNYQKNSLSNMGSATPANGDSGGQPGKPPEYLHGEPYGAAVTNSGSADCEAGQRGYVDTSAMPETFNTQYTHVVIDPHTPVPYPAGPTYQWYDNGGHGLGPTHVPVGETFTRDPGGLGAQLPADVRTQK
jgi:ABC-type transporter Mla subunit MlaD